MLAFLLPSPSHRQSGAGFSCTGGLDVTTHSPYSADCPVVLAPQQAP